MLELSLQDRERSPVDETVGKMAYLIGKRAGIIKRVAEVPLQADNLGVFQYHAEVNSLAHSGAGKGFTRHGAIAAAIGEAVERYCSATYHRDDWIYAPHGKVKDRCVRLEDFALFSDEQYATDCAELSRISSDTKLNWVTGYSLTQARPILVPCCFVFLPYAFVSTEDCIVWEGNSTGTATGASLEEAILSGIYEVVERDALMITWLNRLPVPRIDLSTVQNRVIQDFLAKAARFDLELFVSDVTTDLQIPTLLCVCVDKKGNEPIVVVASACDLDPERALLKTLQELAQGRAVMDDIKTTKRHADYCFSGDCRQVKELRDHFLIYARNDLRAEFQFLTDPDRITKGIDEIANQSSNHVLENIRLSTDLVSQSGMDVIVVDLTTPDIKKIGLHVVKVIIPGAQPLNAHYIYRYLGGKRIYQVPQILGYTDRETRAEELNPLPHPFP